MNRLTNTFKGVSFPQITSAQHPVLLFAAIVIAFFLMMRKEGVIPMVLKDFKNKKFLFHVTIISIFSVVVLRGSSDTEKDKHLKDATKKALVALLIAYFAHLEMVFAPFFIVLVFSYFLSGWD